MPLLEPEHQSPIKSLMAEILPSAIDTTKSSKTLRAREILNDKGLSLEQCATEMRHLLDYAEDDSIKVKIVDTALKIHGAMEPEKQSGDISIQFVFQGDSNLGILIPR